MCVCVCVCVREKGCCLKTIFAKLVFLYVVKSTDTVLLSIFEILYILLLNIIDFEYL